MLRCTPSKQDKRLVTEPVNDTKLASLSVIEQGVRNSLESLLRELYSLNRQCYYKMAVRVMHCKVLFIMRCTVSAGIIIHLWQAMMVLMVQLMLLLVGGHFVQSIPHISAIAILSIHAHSIWITFGLTCLHEMNRLH